MHWFLSTTLVVFLTIPCLSQNAYKVYINEIRVNDAGRDNREFIELIGPAGTVLTNFRIALHDGVETFDGEVWSITIGNFTIPDDGITDNSGTALGFYVLGESHVTNVDESTGWGNDMLLDTNAGLILYDDSNNIIDAVAWGSAGDLTTNDPGTITISPPTNANNFLPVTIDDDDGDNSLEAPSNILGDDGSGWTNSSETAGTINSNQTSGDVSLPVTLSSFSATNEKNRIILEWVTESEVNNLGFEILRSTQNSDNFAMISSYQYNPALQGQGNSSTRTEYSFVDNSINENVSYWYKLVDVDFNGNRTEHGPISANLNTITIGGFILNQNYPNPFNPNTTISFEIPNLEKDKLRVVLSVFNSLGQKVTTIFDGTVSSGTYTFNWDGRNDFDRKLPSGVYTYSLRSRNFTSSKKMILLK